MPERDPARPSRLRNLLIGDEPHPEPPHPATAPPVALTGSARRAEATVERLDLTFFGLTEAEAEALSPRTRALLEVGWEALEDAGITDFSQEIGLFLASPEDETGPCTLLAQELALSGPVLRLSSPSGLLAAHLAAQALRDDAAQLALVVGELDDGGLAAVVLRPVKEAVRAGDRLLKVILASGTAAHTTEPSAMIRRVGRKGGRGPTDPVHTLEARGLSGLLQAVSASDPKQVAAVLEAEGDARTCLLLEDPTMATAWARSQLSRAAQGHFEPITAQPPSGTPIPSPFRRQGRPSLTPPQAAERPSTPGYSPPGLDSTPPGRQSIPPSPRLSSDAHVLLLSARSRAALRRRAEQLAEVLPSADLGDLAGTLARRQVAFEHRLAVPARTPEEALAGLRGEGPRRRGTHRSGAPLPVAFLFSGAVPHRREMAAQLYDTEPVFRDTLNRCDALLRHHIKQPLLSVLFPRSDAPTPSHPGLTDPAQFAVQYALAELWRFWGLSPAAVLGYGLGEYVAATVAGILRLNDALALVAARARILSQQVSSLGKMAVIYAPERQVRPLLAPYEDQVALAAIRSPREVVLSGPLAEVDTLLAELHAMGIRTRTLPTPFGLHSPHIEPALDPFEQVARLPSLGLPRITFISSQTGEAVSTLATQAAFWRTQLREPVRFAQALQTLHALGPHALVEIGPRPVMGQMVRDTIGEPALRVPSMRENHDDQQVMLDSLARLWVAGVALDSARRYPAIAPVALPPYPWHRALHDDPEEPLPEEPADPPEELDPLDVPTAADGEPEAAPEPPGILVATSSQAATRPTRDAEPELELDTEAVADQGPEPETQVDQDDRPEVETEVDEGDEAVADAEVDEGTEAEVDEGAEADADADAGADPETQVTHDDRPEAQTEVDEDDEAEVNAEDEDEDGPEPQVTEDDRPEPETEADERPAPAASAPKPPPGPPPVPAGLHTLTPRSLPSPAAIDESTDDEETAQLSPERAAELVKRAISNTSAPEPASVAEPAVAAEPALEPDSAPTQRPAPSPLSPDASPATPRPSPSWEGAEGAEALHRLSWEPIAQAARQEIEPGTFIVLSDAEGLGDYIASLLQEAGHTALRVRPEPAFNRDEVIGIPEPAEAGSWAPLEARLSDTTGLIRVLHLWSLDLEEDSTLPVQFEKATLLGPTAIGQLHSLLQRLGLPASWWAVTRGAVNLAGALPTPGGGLTWGAVSALGGGWIDLDPLDEDADALLDNVLSTDGEGRIALRDGARHALRLQPLAPAEAPRAIRPDLTWLLLTPTDAAVVLAQQLTALGAEHILLATPEEPAPQVLAELEATGARIGIVPMELDDGALDRLFLRLSMEQPVGGVILAPPLAGTDQPHDPDDPWARGALALHDRLAEAPVEHFIALAPSELLVGGAARDAIRGAVALELTRQRQADDQPGETWFWDAWPETPAPLRAEALRLALSRPSTSLAVLPPGPEPLPTRARSASSALPST